MSGACRGLLCFTNSLTFLTSLPILFLALIINSDGHSKCSSYIQGPITVIGILLLVVSLMGMIGSCCRVTFMLWLYEWVLFLCIIFLLCFTMLASMGVHKSSYKGEPAETIHLRQFSDWLQLNVVDKEDWNAIRSCLSETLFCEGQKQPGAVVSLSYAHKEIYIRVDQFILCTFICKLLIAYNLEKELQYILREVFSFQMLGRPNNHLISRMELCKT